ncbi:MAG: hypothetical protein JWQ02_656 [Capsulimonas sp.]|nr:hypothetical protein [Capsulimonas sp.]
MVYKRTQGEKWLAIHGWHTVTVFEEWYYKEYAAHSENTPVACFKLLKLLLKPSARYHIDNPNDIMQAKFMLADDSISLAAKLSLEIIETANASYWQQLRSIITILSISVSMPAIDLPNNKIRAFLKEIALGSISSNGRMVEMIKGDSSYPRLSTGEVLQLLRALSYSTVLWDELQSEANAVLCMITKALKIRFRSTQSLNTYLNAIDKSVQRLEKIQKSAPPVSPNSIVTN